jgi:cephalosporin hydroxylase
VETLIPQMMQIEEEFDELLRYVKGKKLILEIGTCEGGSLYRFMQVADEDAEIVTVDMKVEFHINNNYPPDEEKQSWKKPNQKLHIIWGDSTSNNIIEQVNNILNGRGFDFIFIDGDHINVEKDYLAYKNMSNGIIAFHDLNYSYVKEMWNKIQGHKIEIIKNPLDIWNGIGVYFNYKQQENELLFWKTLLDTDGKRYTDQGFYKLRTVLDLNKYTSYFKTILSEQGKGIDYGCGLISVFQDSGLNMQFYDPLMNEYRKLYKLDNRYIDKIEGKYDYVCCFNVLDHTKDPWTIIDDFKRILSGGGRLYIDVYFDDKLYVPCHYLLIDIDSIRMYLQEFKLVEERIIDAECGKKYQGIYENP